MYFRDVKIVNFGFETDEVPLLRVYFVIILKFTENRNIILFKHVHL